MAEDNKNQVEEKKPKKTIEKGGLGKKKIMVLVVVAVIIIAIIAFVLLSEKEEENGDNGEENNPPTAKIELIQEHFYVNQVIYFNSTSFDEDGDTITHKWDFDDGDTSFEVNTTHTYDEAGSYNVSLSVTDEHEAKSIASVNITVEEIPTVDLTVNVLYTPPEAPKYKVTIETIDMSISTEFVHYYIIDKETSNTIIDGNVLTDSTLNVIFVDITEPGNLSANDYFTVSDFHSPHPNHIGLENGDIFRLTMEGNPEDVMGEAALQ